MSKQEDFIIKTSGNLDYEVHAIFPIPIYTRENMDITEFSEALIELSNCPKNPKNESTFLYGDRSENSYILDHPGLFQLKNKISLYVNEYANSVLGLAGEFAITQSWISVKSPGQRHIAHSHANSIISGVFYFNNPNEVSGLTFVKNDVSNTWQMAPLKNPKINNQFSFNEITLKTENNMLCIFPSYLTHKVEENKSSQDRYSIAFNAVPKYALGFEKELTELEFKRIERE